MPTGWSALPDLASPAPVGPRRSTRGTTPTCALYLRWELDALSIFTDTARPIDQERIDLYEENCVECCSSSRRAKRTRSFAMELGPFGHYFGMVVDRTKKPNANELHVPDAFCTLVLAP